uniref:Uncharacterized protein n=1 Tax=Arundo donax TaxID=35708 RepID=A0A0A9E1G4_ARUDO
MGRGTARHPPPHARRPPPPASPSAPPWRRTAPCAAVAEGRGSRTRRHRAAGLCRPAHARADAPRQPRASPRTSSSFAGSGKRGRASPSAHCSARSGYNHARGHEEHVKHASACAWRLDSWVESSRGGARGDGSGDRGLPAPTSRWWRPSARRLRRAMLFTVAAVVGDKADIILGPGGEGELKVVGRLKEQRDGGRQLARHWRARPPGRHGQGIRRRRRCQQGRVLKWWGRQQDAGPRHQHNHRAQGQHLHAHQAPHRRPPLLACGFLDFFRGRPFFRSCSTNNSTQF